MYRTPLETQPPHDGLTIVYCTECAARAYAGERLNHRETCSDYNVRPIRKRYTDIRRVVTYMVPAEVNKLTDEVVIP